MILIKSKREIEGIRRSCKLAASALQFAGELVKIGKSTGDINDTVKAYIEAFGAKCACLGYKGFPKEMCISVNDVVCHGIPGSQVLKAGDIVKIDITTILDGFFGDTAATFTVGNVPKSIKALIDATKESLSVGIKQVKPGNRIGQIGYEISRYISPKGYGIVHDFAGHGCGLEFHEEPIVLHISTWNNGPIMREGMIFTIEPMISLGSPNVVIDLDGWSARTVDRSLSAQFEHMVLVTKEGCEVLTVDEEKCYSL